MRIYVGAVERGIALARDVCEDNTVFYGVQICRTGRFIQMQMTAVHLARFATREWDHILGSGAVMLCLAAARCSRSP